MADSESTPEPQSEPEPEAEAEAYRKLVISMHFIWIIAIIFLNLFLIVAFLRCKKLKLQLSTPYMISILLGSLLMGILAVPIGVSGYFKEDDLMPKWVCRLTQYMSHLSIMVMILTLAAHAIANLRFGLFGRITGTMMSLTAVWLASGLWSLRAPFTEYGVSLEGSDVLFQTCSPVPVNKIEDDRHRRWIEFGLFIAAPVGIILVCNWIHHVHFDSSSERQNSQEDTRKMIKVSMVLLLVFLICQLPLQIYYFARYMRINIPIPEPEPETEPEISSPEPATVSEPMKNATLKGMGYAEPEPEGSSWDKDGMIIQSFLFLSYANAFVNPIVIMFMVKGIICCSKKRNSSVGGNPKSFENEE